jgi:soluble lytic murein transglycosylase-like protein
LAFLLATTIHVTHAHADIFAFVAEDGVVHFSDQPTDPRHRLVLSTEIANTKAAAGTAAPHPPTAPSRQQLAAAISAAARESGIDRSLLHAVVQTESDFNTRAVSPKGALGLMQLMPDTARRYGVTDPMDAAQNLRGGARHLRDLLQMFSNNLELALAAYNAGAGSVMAHGRRVPPYVETLRYVPTVLRNYEQQRRIASDSQD